MSIDSIHTDCFSDGLRQQLSLFACDVVVDFHVLAPF